MNQQNSRFARHTLAAAALATWAAAAGCAANVPTDGAPCPCAVGNVCCASGVCAKDQASCPASAPDDNDNTMSALREAPGEWSGYVENYKFSSGSDAIRLSFHLGGDGKLAGTVTLGMGTPPPPATDPNVNWPVGLSYMTLVDSINFPIEGFSFTAQDIQVDHERLRLTFVMLEPWQPWCALHPPIAGQNGDYYPVPDVSYHREGPNGPCFFDTLPTPTQVTCDDALLPRMICTCTASACTASGRPISLDVALRGGKGDGSLDIQGFHNIRLTKGH